MNQAERYDLLEISLEKLARLRDELLNGAEPHYERWNGQGTPPVKFPDGSVYHF